MRFHDRTDAGRRLAEQVVALNLVDPIVLALPRGGVPVAAEVASALDAPLEVFVARKIGAPRQPEFGMGAIAEGDVVVVNEEAVRMLDVPPAKFDAVVERERGELQRRVRLYRGDRSLPELTGREVVLVDDGLATGVTAEASLRALRMQDPARLVLAVPVCTPDTADRLRAIADDVVSVVSTEHVSAVGQWYADFSQVSDNTVVRLLRRSSPA